MVVYGKFCMLQSAKTNLNVEQVFFSIARDIKQRLAETDTKAEVESLSNNKLLRVWKLNQLVWVQDRTIKINKPDQAAAEGTAAAKSACCGSWESDRRGGGWIGCIIWEPICLWYFIDATNIMNIWWVIVILILPCVFHTLVLRDWRSNLTFISFWDWNSLHCMSYVLMTTVLWVLPERGM